MDIGETPIDDTPMSIERVGVSIPLWQARFLLPLEVTPLDDGVRWQSLTAFDFESITLDRIITVPAGTISDFASIPRSFWTLVGGPTGPYTKPSFLHDYCYHTLGFCTRLQADHVLLEAMDVMGVSWLTKQEVYRGVRLGGASSYKGGL